MAYALNTHKRPHNADLSTLLHRGEHIDEAHRHLNDLIEDLLINAAQAGQIRDDVPVPELTSYCLNALSAARSAASEENVHRLVAVVLDGLRPPCNQQDQPFRHDPTT